MRIDTQASPVVSYAAFAAFGVFWGTWGAALPALRTAVAVDDAALGTALLFVGLGALPTMLLTGRLVDRVGARVTGGLLVGLAGAGILLAAVARDLPTLCAGMAIVGSASGAADVAENALAGLAEQRTGRRVITTAHAVFSSCVVLGGLGTGALRAAGAGVAPIFAVAGALVAMLGVPVLLRGDRPRAARPATPTTTRNARNRLAPFVAVGLVGALGFALENAHQSWSAVFLADELHASPGLSALAPATFAASGALTRFAVGATTRVPHAVLLRGGSALALLGTLIVSVAPGVALALAGLTVTAVGTSVLFPTLLSRATADVAPEHRGRATSAVATTAYLGFVLGPVYVGLLAGSLGLRGAMMGVAALAAAFALLGPRVGQLPTTPTGQLTPVPPRPQ